MTIVLAGVLLGVAGSVHCAAMCGPLVLLAHAGGTPAGAMRLAWRTAPYHAGRVGMYALLGALAGGAGHVAGLAGLARPLSVIAGVVLIASAIAVWRAGQIAASPRRAARALVAALAAATRRLPRNRWPGRVALGALNGLLPCGLIYMALAGAAGLGHALDAAFFMAAFGAGTLPIFAGLAASAGLGRWRRLSFRHAAPAGLALVGVLLVVRGLAPSAAADPHAAHRPHLAASAR